MLLMRQRRRAPAVRVRVTPRCVGRRRRTDCELSGCRFVASILSFLDPHTAVCTSTAVYYRGPHYFKKERKIVGFMAFAPERPI